MTQLLTELKTRARLRLNAARRQDAAGQGASAGGAGLRLRDCLHEVARDAGFAHWEHARQVLDGQAREGDDMGTFWYAPRCSTLLNLWFPGYEPARAAQAGKRGAFLLPYRRQCVVAQDDFVRELGLDPAHEAWAALGRDLVAGYGTPAWAQLALLRLKAQAAQR